jgi:endonuclease/exonuclease/phosphatase family metal-dependent hydrolase
LIRYTSRTSRSRYSTKDGKILKSLATFVILFLLVGQSYASLKITSYNIRTFGKDGETTNTRELKKIIKDLRSDIIGVQEIVNSRSFHSFIRSNFKNYNVVLSKCGGGGKQKLGFVYDKTKLKLIKHIEDDSISDPQVDKVRGGDCDASLRPLMLGFFQEIKTKRKLLVIGVHLKAGGSERSFAKRAVQYKMLKDIYKSYEAKYKNIIVLGDFNTTGYDDRNIDYDRYMSMVSGMRASDITRKISCTAYWGGEIWDDEIEEPSILDHILISRNLQRGKVTGVRVDAHCKRVNCAEAEVSELGTSYESVSDHCPISATIQ